MSDKIVLDPSIASDIKQGMEMGGGIQLPFAAPYAWVTNGKKELKQLGGVSYFGGWNTDKAAVDELIETTQNTLPSYFKEFERETEKDVLHGYEARYLFVAPIAWRQAWVTDDKQRHPEFVEGGRHHIQVLCYLLDHIVTGEKENKVSSYPGWGPIVLSGKGYQARNIRDAFSAWEKATQNIRRELAPGVPSYFFALCIGTFGEAPVYKVVGKGSNTKPITPITAFIPPEIKPEVMKRLFVGETVASIMVDLKKQATDWLNAWKGSVGQDSIPAGSMDEEGVNAALESGEAPF